MRGSVTTLLAAALAVGVTAPSSAAPLKVAAFDFELYDTSTEGEINGARPDEAERIDQITEQVRAFVKDKGIELVDTAPVKKEIDSQSLRTCGACSSKLAGTLGADYSLMGYVQKVSNLILNINVEIRDVKTGQVVRKGSADIRGNTEESWRHGTRYLMRHTILKEPLPEAKAP